MTNENNWPIGGHLENFNNPHEVTKDQVGLGNVDNVRQYSELNPPPNHINTVCGKLPDASGNIDLLKGDVNLGKVDNVKQYSASNPPPYPVSSVNGQTGDVNIILPDTSGIQTNLGAHIANVCNPHQVTKDQVGLGNVPNVLPYHTGNKPGKADIGLGNVDNTSDADKPVSTAVQAALNTKLDQSQYTEKSILEKIMRSGTANIGLKDIDAEVGYTTKKSRYTIIGNMCFIQFHFNFNGELPSTVTRLELDQLPVPPVNYVSSSNYLHCANLKTPFPPIQTGNVVQYGTEFRLYASNGTSRDRAWITTDWLTKGTLLAGSLWYNI